MVQRRAGARTSFDGLVGTARAAIKCGDEGTAAALYRQAALLVARAVRPPHGLVLPQPKVTSLSIDLRLGDYAFTDARLVADNPDNPWRWITLGERAFGARATLDMVLRHELVHAHQNQRSWAAYNASTSQPKPSWDSWLKRRGRGSRTALAELEAEVEVVGSIATLPPADRDQQILRLFVALLSSGEYVSRQRGAEVRITPSQAAVAIMHIYRGATPALKSAFASRLYRAILEVSIPKEQMTNTLLLVRPIAVAGFGRIPRTLQLSFLSIPGLREVVAASTKR